MSKLALSAVGLLGVGAGALGAWVVRPPQESASSAAAEQLVVLRDIQHELAAVRESLATSSLPAVPPQAAAGVAQPEPQVQSLVSDLQQALAQLISEGAQLQAAASAGGVVAEGAPRLPANEQVVRETLALLPAAGAPCFVRELFGLSPAAAYRKFGTPSYVQQETGSGSVHWCYVAEGPSTLTLTFTDGYLSAAKK